MKEDWYRAIEFVLKEEGGYTLDPNDHGGETNFGISKTAYPNEDIKNMTRERAMEIYKRDYWNVCRCDEIPSPLAIAVFDSAVNTGTHGTILMLQRALMVEAIDGIFGPKTMEALLKSNGISVRRFMAERMMRYVRIVSHDPSQDVFTANWSHRLMRCAELVFSEGVA